MADMSRAKRLADRIKVIVAEALEMRVKDPRLGFVTVTDVRVTGDLREATVFYTVLGDETDVEETAKALASVSGMLRSEVGRLTGVKFTPTLAFRADALPQAARSIDDLLARARAADDEVHRIAADAHYAGEADPYRHDDESDDAADEAGDTNGTGEAATTDAAPGAERDGVTSDEAFSGAVAYTTAADETGSDADTSNADRAGGDEGAFVQTTGAITRDENTQPDPRSGSPAA
ncbi:MAG: 30S ribosome-binding factor RbfA [Actinomycetales bacterium]|nr:30S ribosome-binding factor RbfA [Actinomycetales bacterium]